MSGDSNLDKLSETARRALEDIIRGHGEEEVPKPSDGHLNRLHMLKFQIEQAEANLQVCGQLGHDPNTFMSLRVALGHIERFLADLSEKLNLGKIQPFAQKQFNPAELIELKANLRLWHEQVVRALTH